MTTHAKGKARGASPVSIRFAVAAAVLAVAGLLLVSLPSDGEPLPVLLALGMALGATLSLASFSFSATFRRFLLRGETSGVQALIVLLALATALFAPALAAGSVLGRPIAGAVAPVGISVIAGAFLFGLGAQLAGSGSSGTLFTAGSGDVSRVGLLLFFCAGSFWASLHTSWWERLPSPGAVVLGEHLGWPWAAALQLSVLAAASAWLRRRASVLPQGGPDPFVMSARRRALLAGGALLAILAFFVLLVAGYPWNITWAFTLWGSKAALALGWEPEQSPFWNGDFQRTALESNVFEDVTSITTLGVVLGAMAAAAATGRFQLRTWISAKSLVAPALGGLAMGYGAHVSHGCTIGAFLSGVASTSLHGWIWIIAALGGTAMGIRLRRWCE